MTDSIGAILYLIIQAYEALASSHTNLFRSLLNSQVTMWADKMFLHVPATQFLCKLQDTPTLTTLRKLILSERDWLVFQKVAGSLPLCKDLEKAIRELSAATWGKKVVKG